MNAPASILVRGVNWLGDAVMTTPALMRLREAFPKARIGLLVPEKLADLWIAHPAIDQTLTFKAGESPWTIGRSVKPYRFETALVFPNSPRSALEMWFAGIPERIGYARPWRNWMLTRAVPVPTSSVTMHKRSVAEIKQLIDHGQVPEKVIAAALGDQTSIHHVHHYLHLVAALGAKAEPLHPKIEVASQEVANFIERIGGPSRPLFGMVPGAEYGPAKRWPAERFAAVAIQIHRQTNCRWVLFGSPKDAAVTADIATRIKAACGENKPCIDLAGATSLRELCAGLKACRLVLTNDTGAMHVASAVGTPVIALFGSTSPEMTGPSLSTDPRHICLRAPAACSPCFLRECPIDFRCMTGITVETVVQRVMEKAA